MNRRETLKNIATAATLVALPSWAQGWHKDSLTTGSSVFSELEQQYLSVITDTIIPAGDSIGALSAGVDQFVVRLLSDCYEPEVQDKVKAMLQGATQLAEASFGKVFAECDQSQRLEILEQLEASEKDADVKTFHLIKGETVRGFRTSKVVMTEYLGYQVMPGHFHGCIDVNT